MPLLVENLNKKWAYVYASMKGDSMCNL